MFFRLLSLIVALTIPLHAESPVFQGLRNAAVAAAPPADQAATEIRTAAAGFLSGYLKQNSGNHLAERHSGSTRIWTEMRNLRLSRLTRTIPTAAEAARGISECVLVLPDYDSFRTYSVETSQWSQWRPGRDIFIPANIRVTRITGGAWTASPDNFPQLTRFSAHGDPSITSSLLRKIPSAPPAAAAFHSTFIQPAPQIAAASSVSAAIKQSGDQLGATATFLMLMVILAAALFLIPLAVLQGYLESPATKGRRGERRVIMGVLGKLDPLLYQHFNDLYLPHPDGHGTTQIDHVVVSPFGIFVIETKNYTGWIFGSEKQSQWTQQIYRRKSRFQNPLHQNHLHVRALSAFLSLPVERFHSAVFFVGSCQLKTPLPANVVTCDHLAWIRSHSQQILGHSVVPTIAAGLRELERTTDRQQAAITHVQTLAARTSC
ncbi:MAG: nuclease-related domain-containing protein [Luteolibacter sp.]